SSRRPPPPSLEEVSKCRSPAEVFGLLFPSQPGVGGSEEGSFSAEEAEAPPLRSWSLLLAVSCFRRLAQLRSSSSDSSRSGAKQQRQPVTPEKESFQFQSLLRRLEGLAASSEMSARTLSEVMAAAGHLGSSSKSSSNSSNNSSSNSYINSNSDSNSNSNNNSSSNSNSNSNSHSNNNSQPGIEALVRRCAASLTQGIHRANAFDLSSAAWALAKLQVVDGPFMQSLSSRAPALSSEFDAQRLSNLELPDPLPVLLSEAPGMASHLCQRHNGGMLVDSAMDTQQAAGVSQGCTAPRSNTWSHLGHQVSLVSNGTPMRSFAAVETLRSLGRIAQGAADDCFKGLAHEAVIFFKDFLRNIGGSTRSILEGEFRMQEVSNVCWALAKLQAVAQELKAQELCNIAWALATLCASDGVARLLLPTVAELLAVVAPTAGAGLRLAHFAPQNLANLAWALARLAEVGVEAFQKLLPPLAQVAISRMAEFRAQELAQLVSSAAANLRRALQPRLGFREAGGEFKRASGDLAWAFAAASGDQGCSSRLLLAGNWLLARLGGACGARASELAPLELSAAAWALSRLEQFTAQGICNLAWAAATTSLEDGGFMARVAEESATRLAEFEAIVRLLLAAISQEALAKIADFQPAGLALLRTAFENRLVGLSWVLARLPVRAPGTAAAAARFVQVALGGEEQGSPTSDGGAGAGECGLVTRSAGGPWRARASEVRGSEARLQVAWALNFAGALDEEILAAFRKSLAGMGRALDAASTDNNSSSSKNNTNNSAVRVPPLPLRADHGPEVPQVLLDLPDRLVLYKPTGWQVDDDEEGRLPEDDRGSLASFLRAALPRALRAMVEDVRHQRGLLHRLDVPSSGLVLAAKTYEAYFDLQLQLQTGSVIREYVVLCHGWLEPSRGQVEAPIHWATSNNNIDNSNNNIDNNNNSKNNNNSSSNSNNSNNNSNNNSSNNNNQSRVSRLGKPSLTKLRAGN
ncbi:unnamed protein product, partial [Polarella glacialis]